MRHKCELCGCEYGDPVKPDWKVILGNVIFAACCAWMAFVIVAGILEAYGVL